MFCGVLSIELTTGVSSLGRTVLCLLDIFASGGIWDVRTTGTSGRARLGGLGGPWEGPGRALGGPWEPWEGPGRVLGALGGPWEPSGSPGRALGALGGPWEGPGRLRWQFIR